jgi:hypothetical protein
MYMGRKIIHGERRRKNNYLRKQASCHLMNCIISFLHPISTKSLDNYELKEDMIKAKENAFYIYRRSKD